MRFRLLRNRPGLRRVIATLIGNGWLAVSAAIGGILVARALGPAERGHFAAAMVWAAIVGALFNLGFNQTSVYFGRTERADSPRVARLVLGAALVLAVVGMLAGIAAVLILRPAARREIVLYLVSIPFTALIGVVAALASGRNDFYRFNLLRGLSGFAYLVVVTIALLAGWREARPVLGLMVLSWVALSAYALWTAVRHFDILSPCSGEPMLVLARRVFTYGGKSYLGNLSWFANPRLDQLFMSKLFAPVDLGIYAVAVSYSTLTVPLAGAFANVLFPRVARDPQKSSVYRFLAMGLGLTLLVNLGLYLASPRLIPLLFGVEFLASVKLVGVLLAATFVFGANYVLADGLRGLGHPLLPSLAEMAGLLINLAGLSMLLPKYGYQAAPWIVLASYSVVCLLQVTFLLSKRTSRNDEVP